MAVVDDSNDVKTLLFLNHRELLPGVGRDLGLIRGHTMETQKFKLVYEGSAESHLLDISYNWKDIMRMVLDVAGNVYSTAELETELLRVLRTWSGTFQAFGLLFLVQLSRLKELDPMCEALTEVKTQWNENTGGMRTPQKVFDAAKVLFEQGDREYGLLQPVFEIDFEENFQERVTMIHVRFGPPGTPAVRFKLERNTELMRHIKKAVYRRVKPTENAPRNI